MSIKNILSQNDYSAYLENLNVSNQIINSWGNIPGLFIVNHSVPVYYGDNFETNLTCTFIRISYGIQTGLCFISIPFFTSNIPGDTGNHYFYLDISSFNDVLINQDISQVISVVSNGSPNFSLVNFSSSDNHIYIYGGPSKSSTFLPGGNPTGWSYNLFMMYQQAFI